MEGRTIATFIGNVILWAWVAFVSVIATVLVVGTVLSCILIAVTLIGKL